MLGGGGEGLSDDAGLSQIETQPQLGGYYTRTPPTPPPSLTPPAAPFLLFT